MGGLNVGTLTINLALDVSKMTKQSEEMNARLKSMGSIAESVFKSTGGHVGQLGERVVAPATEQGLLQSIAQDGAHCDASP
jgi:hypothetical protein